MSDTILPAFERFYESARNGELRFPRCEACGRFHWYPMKLCPHCRSDSVVWARVDGPARLFSWTRVEHGFDAELAMRVPYVVALVEFEDAPGVRYVTNLVDTRPDELKIDMRLKPIFPIGGTAIEPVRFTAHEF